jgi:superfamily II DNA or RNA helicase
MRRQQQNYIDFKVNGRLFPSWILANFSNYKLPNIILSKDNKIENEEIEQKKKLKKYQEFIGKFMDYNSPYRSILLYHGVGSGKTVTTINIYNILYNYTPGWNVYILLKASLKQKVWIETLEKWLNNNEYQGRYDNIKFISYDAPNADQQFTIAMQKSDATKKSLFIIEEAHNFIRNVYSNVTTKQGMRGQKIYDEILRNFKTNNDTRIIMLSGTPVINAPFELALLFNLLRPNIFPSSEKEFENLFITQNALNPTTKNMFQRRILGLVSYYIGATPDLYASKKTYFIDCSMSKYQDDLYAHYEKIEDIMRSKNSNFSSAEKYRTYTRQACNFVFPYINQFVNGETRPRPADLKISKDYLKQIDEGKIDLSTTDIDKIAIKHYFEKVSKFITDFDDYLFKIQKDDEINGWTIFDDLKTLKDDYKLLLNNPKKSKLLTELYKCSCKITTMILISFKSKGPCLMYSNFVLLEGLQIVKIYLKYFGYTKFNNETNKGLRYTEFHGQIDKETRETNLSHFNKLDNKYGEICKIILISPAGAEGLNLMNVRQIHLLEPYWHETRMIQMIGRGVRLESHKFLPIDERHVDVYRYKAIKIDATKKITTDQYIEESSLRKDKLLESFLLAIKEVAIDCNLFASHNMISQTYQCFQFENNILLAEQVGPSYQDDLFDDNLYNNGLNDINSELLHIKTKKVKAVIELQDGKYSEPKDYWLDPISNTVYDFDLLYLIGKIHVKFNGIPEYHNNSYIINKVVAYPLITSKNDKNDKK